MTSSMHVERLEKPDGRSLWLYAHAPPRGALSSTDGPAPMPSGEAAPPSPHLRWHPLRGEWIAYAEHRRHDTDRLSPAWDPLAPTTHPERPTEVPAGAWEIAVFEDRSPTLYGGATEAPDLIVATLRGRGACEVVVFGQEATGSLGTLPLERIELAFDVWADRTRGLGERDDVAYVFAFENRGIEVGVTLQHPHGLIYGYPFVPPIPARELEQQRAFLELHGRGLLERWIEQEVEDGRRMLYEGEHAVAFVPVCARWGYETWVAPRRAVESFVDVRPEERRDLARALKTALLKLDGLWGIPMPYTLTFHQAPTDGLAHPSAHLHAEILPALRMPGRLEHLAGSELGAGAFIVDTSPEERAAELRRVEVSIE